MRSSVYRPEQGRKLVECHYLDAIGALKPGLAERIFVQTHAELRPH